MAEGAAGKGVADCAGEIVAAGGPALGSGASLSYGFLALFLAEQANLAWRAFFFVFAFFAAAQAFVFGAGLGFGFAATAVAGAADTNAQAAAAMSNRR